MVVLTTSTAAEDVPWVYDLSGNCDISKPVEFQAFLEVVRSIEHSWLTIVKPHP